MRFADGLEQGCADTWKRYIVLAPPRNITVKVFSFIFPRNVPLIAAIHETAPETSN